jgi:hypothetical protein
MSDSDFVCDNPTPSSKHSQMIQPKLGSVQPGQFGPSQEPLKVPTPAVGGLTSCQALCCIPALQPELASGNSLWSRLPPSSSSSSSDASSDASGSDHSLQADSAAMREDGTSRVHPGSLVLKLLQTEGLETAQAVTIQHTKGKVDARRNH